MAVKHTFIYKGGKSKTSDLSPVKAIKQKCLECSAWNHAEVRLCTAYDCALYPFRLGKDPSRKRVLTDEQRKVAAERMRAIRENAQKSK